MFVSRIFCVSMLLIACSLGGCSSKKNATVDGTGLTEAELNAQREARFGSGSIPLAEGGGMFRDIHFDYDSSQIKDSTRADVEYNAEVLRNNPSLKVMLEGHCDERGTAEYNMALGADRAKSVRDMLVSLGIATARVDSISYGEEVPLDQGHDEVAWAKNRRVHLSAFGTNK